MKAITLRFLVLAALVLAAVSLSPLGAHAQSKSVVVRERNGDVTIVQDNGDLKFDETWVVQFAGGPFTFAFRCIQQGRYNSIQDWGVSQNGIEFSHSSSGSAGTYELYTENNQDCIRWHFAPTTNASRTFNLRYTVVGGLRIYDAGDQFYWNFIESDRQYTIQSSTVTLHIPGDLTPDQVKASTARNLTENAAGAQVVDGNTVAFSGKNFADGDLWTLRAQFPHGIVNAQAPGWQTAEDAKQATKPFIDFGLLVLSLIVLIGGGLGVYLLWFTRGRDRATGVVAEYLPNPPSADPPGVVGTLLDERADMQDIVATIVDLARRGVIQMTEKSEPGFLGIGTKHEFTFKRVGTANNLRPYEEAVLDRVFGGSDERDLEDLKYKFYKYLPEIQKEMYQEVVRAGYYQTNPNDARIRYSVLGIAALVVLGCIGFVLFGTLIDLSPVAFCPLIAFGLVGAALLIVAQFMPKRTNDGAMAYAKWNAFKRYLANIDKYTQVAEAKDLFDKYLPYAIAFGLERSWIDRFAAVDTPAPTWYYPYGYYGPYHRGGGRSVGGDNLPSSSSGSGGRMPSLNEASAAGFRGLNSMSAGLFSMLTATSSVFGSAPSSSGGGGGGWSGGGGFGGGGGGGGGSSGFG